jgi:hypothetical protein
VNVDQGVLQTALAKALVDSVTPEMQSQALREAMVGYLYAPQKEPYSGKETTPLSRAFEKSLDAAARQACEEVLSQPENQARIKTTLQAAFEQSMSSTLLTEKLVERFLSNFSRW